jgi:MscS family membrane protein
MNLGTRIFGLIAGLFLLSVGSTAGAWHPLEPPDTSSPRATIESFLALVEAAAERYSEYRQSPSPETYSRISEVARKAEGLLDLSQVPPAARSEESLDTLLLLWEVIARIELPELAEIPGAELVASSDKEGERLTRWRIPHTEISIVRIEEGPRTGEYLFSADTVARALSFFESVKDLPYQRPVPLENMYHTQQTATGWMIPLAWVAALPDWASMLVFEQVRWKWLALLLLVSIAVLVGLSVFRWARGRPKDGSLRSYLIRLSTPLTIAALGQLLAWISDEQIIATGMGEQAMVYLENLANGAALVWILWVTATWIADAIIESPRIHAESLDAHLIRLTAVAPAY